MGLYSLVLSCASFAFWCWCHLFRWFLVSFRFTLNFRNVDQRPGFFVAFTYTSDAFWWPGNSCTAGNALFVFVAPCATFLNLKTPWVVCARKWPAVLGVNEDCFFVQIWGAAVLCLRAGFTHLLLPNPWYGCSVFLVPSLRHSCLHPIPIHNLR